MYKDSKNCELLVIAGQDQHHMVQEVHEQALQHRLLMPGGWIHGLAPHCQLPGKHQLWEAKAGMKARGQKKGPEA